MKCLILAGGKSRRMGRSKALIERPDGRRQIDHLVQLCLSLDQAVIISTNSPEIAPEGIETLPDLHAGDGPLGALASFADRYPGEPALLLGCDYFLMTDATLRELIDQRDPASAATAFRHRLDGRPEPLCSIIEPAGFKEAARALEADKFCIRHFLESVDPKLLTPRDSVALDNANSPVELAEAFAKLRDGVREKQVKLLYFAQLREARGLDEENYLTHACTAGGLYEELRFKFSLPLESSALRCARNGDFCDWSTPVSAHDEFVFIPPVAGG